MRISRQQIERKAAGWLRQGISPQRLAFTLALGFTIGCLPLVGVPTFACTALALGLGLNLPAIQAANYLAMPFQLALIVPFLKLGGRLMAFGVWPTLSAEKLEALPRIPGMTSAIHMSGMAGKAVLGWLLVAVPAALLLTAALSPMLRRIPAIAKEEAATPPC
jgi:hypothetical protein